MRNTRPHDPSSANSISCARTVIAWLMLAALIVIPFGCKRADEPEASDTASPGAMALPPYPSSLDADSSPSEVAEVLIAALEADDDATLIGLVAVEDAKKNVDAIFSKYGKKSNADPAQVAAMTAAGWGASYAFFKPGRTTVARETIDGDTAVVIADGFIRRGDARELRISMIREEGVWKVRAGLNSDAPGGRRSR